MQKGLNLFSIKRSNFIIILNFTDFRNKMANFTKANQQLTFVGIRVKLGKYIQSLYSICVLY